MKKDDLKTIVEIQDVNAANSFYETFHDLYRQPEFSETRGYIFIKKVVKR